MEGISLRILWVFGRGMSYWPVYRGWPVYRWPVWEVSLYSTTLNWRDTPIRAMARAA